MVLSRIVLAFMLALWGVAARADPSEPRILYLGSVAMEAPAEMVKRLAPLTRYLSAHTGLQVVFRASPTMDAAIADLGSGSTHIAYMTPVAYVEAHRRFGAQPLAAPLTDGKSTFRLVMVVREASSIRSVSDLKGRTFAFGDERARLQQAVVVGAGMPLEQFSNYAFLKHYDNIAKAVLNEDFDAGILTEGVFGEYASRGLRVLHESPPLPSYVFAVAGKLPPRTAAKLHAAFLSLRADTQEHREILGKLGKGYDGFATARDADYEVVRRLIAPFAQR